MQATCKLVLRLGIVVHTPFYCSMKTGCNALRRYTYLYVTGLSNNSTCRKCDTAEEIRQRCAEGFNSGIKALKTNTTFRKLPVKSSCKFMLRDSSRTKTFADLMPLLPSLFDCRTTFTGQLNIVASLVDRCELINLAPVYL
jgi:hypothetical protein